jgi:hypothetical protein
MSAQDATSDGATTQDLDHDFADDPGHGQLIGSSYFTMVAVDDQGRPVKVPPLRVETPDEHRRHESAALRREFRREIERRNDEIRQLHRSRAEQFRLGTTRVSRSRIGVRPGLLAQALAPEGGTAIALAYASDRRMRPGSTRSVGVRAPASPASEAVTVARRQSAAIFSR